MTDRRSDLPWRDETRALITEQQAAHAHLVEWAVTQGYVPPGDEPPVDPPVDPPPAPDPFDGAFLTHTELGLSPEQFAAQVRERIAAGECDGVMMYRGEGSPLDVDPYVTALVASGPPCVTAYSPKNVTDPEGARRWAAAWPEPWRPFVLAQFFQECQGNFGNAGQPPITAWHDGVRALADACDPVGIRTGAHLETYSLGPYQPHGGTARAHELLGPVATRLAVLTLSVFEFSGKDRGVMHAANGHEFAASYPSLRLGFTAVGDSVPRDAGDDVRRARATRLATTFGAIAGTRATMAGSYSLARPPESTRDFYDQHVRDLLTLLEYRHADHSRP